jgi:hypothetical protein
VPRGGEITGRDSCITHLTSVPVLTQNRTAVSRPVRLFQGLAQNHENAHLPTTNVSCPLVQLIREIWMHANLIVNNPRAGSASAQGWVTKRTRVLRAYIAEKQMFSIEKEILCVFFLSSRTGVVLNGTTGPCPRAVLHHYSLSELPEVRWKTGS